MSRFKNMQTQNELADYLAVPRKKLTHILYVRRIENCYVTFTIPKRSGGTRDISAPDSELKSIQKKLAFLLQRYRYSIWEEKGISPNIAHAFEKKKGIITNARIHRNKRYVINIDLVDFFGNIHLGRIIGYFEKNENFKMSHEVATAMAQLCCYKGKLPQGAPTSPVISNMICEILDFKLLQIAKKYHLDYTRYADDLTFSTNDKTFLEKYESFYNSVSGAIRHAGFEVNEKKTRVLYRDSQQTVTGLVVNKKLSVDHRYYKDTRAMANQLYKTGEFQIRGETGTLAQLEGRFAFINQLDKYDNENCQENMRNFRCLNGREREYQKFLFYKYFYANSKPLIVTEGKTDILYLKAALMNQHTRYPELIEIQPDGTFNFKIRFLRRSKRLQYFLNIGMDGADTMQNIYAYYTGRWNKDRRVSYFKLFSEKCPSLPTHPVILVFDNELDDKNKPIHKFINPLSKDIPDIENRIKTSLSLQLMENSNLHLVTHQLVDGKAVCEIEDLFDEPTRGIIIDGRKLSLKDKWNPKTEYGKDVFSKYVLGNYKSIDFSRFTIMLDKINNVVVGKKIPVSP